MWARSAEVVPPAGTSLVMVCEDAGCFWVVAAAPSEDGLTQLDVMKLTSGTRTTHRAEVRRDCPASSPAMTLTQWRPSTGQRRVGALSSDAPISACADAHRGRCECSPSLGSSHVRTRTIDHGRSCGRDHADPDRALGAHRLHGCWPRGTSRGPGRRTWLTTPGTQQSSTSTRASTATEVADYLERGFVARAYMGVASCRLCSRANGALELTGRHLSLAARLVALRARPRCSTTRHLPRAPHCRAGRHRGCDRRGVLVEIATRG